MELLISTAAETHSHKEGGVKAHTKSRERRKKCRKEHAGVLVGLALALLFCGADVSLVETSASLWLLRTDLLFVYVGGKQGVCVCVCVCVCNACVVGIVGVNEVGCMEYSARGRKSGCSCL